MSYKVKPEDVTLALRQDIAKRLFDHHVREWKIASIINAAIEAGLVSPPCWAMRNCNSELVTHQRVFTSREAAEDGLRYRYTIEHWKGQTE